MKTKIIALCGKAGSGKDTILQHIVAKYPDKFHEIVSCTTRPAREGERDGVNYHFCSDKDFADKVIKGDMLEYTCFNSWFYGTAYSNLTNEKINIGVFNPSGIIQLQGNPNIDLSVYWVRADAKLRLIRQLNRETHPDVDEIIRRYNADEDDFKIMDKITYTDMLNNDRTDLQLCITQIGEMYSS